MKLIINGCHADEMKNETTLKSLKLVVNCMSGIGSHIKTLVNQCDANNKQLEVQQQENVINLSLRRKHEALDESIV